jgi:hypothetical protein
MARGEIESSKQRAREDSCDTCHLLLFCRYTYYITFFHPCQGVWSAIGEENTSGSPVGKVFSGMLDALFHGLVNVSGQNGPFVANNPGKIESRIARMDEFHERCPVISNQIRAIRPFVPFVFQIGSIGQCRLNILIG